MREAAAACDASGMALVLDHTWEDRQGRGVAQIWVLVPEWSARATVTVRFGDEEGGTLASGATVGLT